MTTLNLKPWSSPEEKRSICDACKHSRVAIEDEFKLNTVYVDDFIDESDIVDVERDLAEVTKTNWTRLTKNNIPIFRYAAYEYILSEKINVTEFDDSLWPGYLIYARNALLTYAAGNRIFDTFKADALVVYNSAYSCNHVMCAIAEELGIPHYTLHAGAHHKYRLSEMTIFKGLTSSFGINRSRAWSKYSRLALSRRAATKAHAHVEELLEARSPWVYSIKAQNRSRRELFEILGIEGGRKVVLATMASGDERFAASLVDALPPYQPPFFDSQQTWVEQLIQWARSRSDISLIIRVHPREFPNKREQVLSKHAEMLRIALANVPANVRVNWPEDNISLHDLAKITDVCLNATSTAGLELLLLGVPVIVYDADQLFSYPPGLNVIAKSREDYFLKIDETLKIGRNLKGIIMAYRWIAFKSEVVSIDIGDVYSETKGTNVDVSETRLAKYFRGIAALFNRKTDENTFEYKDPFVLRQRPLKPRSSKWLAYAVEKNEDSHIEAYVRANIWRRMGRMRQERLMVYNLAKQYLDKLGIPSDFADS